MPYLDILEEALTDTLPLVPVLFLLYIGLEVAVRGGSLRLARFARHADSAGPLAGAVLGIVPQCGMSVFMSSLFLSGRISRGTLVATYLATSDEALPVLFAHGNQLRLMGAVVIGKLVLGVLGGWLVDALPGHRYYLGKKATAVAATPAEVECELHGPDVWHLARHAFGRTMQIVWWVFVVTFALGIGLEWLGTGWIAQANTHPVLGVLGTAFFGLVPNCAASIAIAEGAIRGLIPFSAMMAGLAAGAGFGPIVLMREGSNRTLVELLALCLVLSIGIGLLLVAAGY